MRRILGGGAVAAILMAVLVGCGAATTTGGAQSSSSGAAQATASATTAPVKTTTITVGGTSHTVLTNASGYTLYYYTKDTPTSSACTGSCAGLWPALTTSFSKLQSPSGLGAFTVVKDAHGNQVAYKGHLLYTYTGDTAPGQANGQGKFGVWWVATPSMAGGQGAASGSSGGGGW